MFRCFSSLSELTRKLQGSISPYERCGCSFPGNPRWGQLARPERASPPSRRGDDAHLQLRHIGQEAPGHAKIQHRPTIQVLDPGTVTWRLHIISPGGSPRRRPGCAPHRSHAQPVVPDQTRCARPRQSGEIVPNGSHRFVEHAAEVHIQVGAVGLGGANHRGALIVHGAVVRSMASSMVGKSCRRTEPVDKLHPGAAPAAAFEYPASSAAPAPAVSPLARRRQWLGPSPDLTSLV